MMRIALTVEYLDGSGVEVTASAPDLNAFEETYDMALGDFQKNPRIKYLMFIAWHALKRNKLTTDTFEPWMERVDSIQIAGSPE